MGRPKLLKCACMRVGDSGVNTSNKRRTFRGYREVPMGGSPRQSLARGVASAADVVMVVVKSQ